MKRLVPLLALVLLYGHAAAAHEILGPVEVNRLLKSMQQWHNKLAATTAAEKHEALFNIGLDAYALMKLINSDVKEHGAENQGLIDLAVNRSAALGVRIARMPGTDFYLYDFDAFVSYLRLAPRGEHAAEARFALVEKKFYEQKGDATPAPLLERVAEKRKLLEDYPQFGRRADLEMFLILDYLDLSNAYIEAGDRAKSDEYKQLALRLCRELAEKYPDTGAAMFARDLLIKLGI